MTWAHLRCKRESQDIGTTSSDDGDGAAYPAYTMDPSYSGVLLLQPGRQGNGSRKHTVGSSHDCNLILRSNRHCVQDATDKLFALNEKRDTALNNPKCFMDADYSRLAVVVEIKVAPLYL